MLNQVRSFVKHRVAAVLTLAMLLSLLPTTALAATVAASGTCGVKGAENSVTWTLTEDGVLTISGSGAMRNFEYVSIMGTPWVRSGWESEQQGVTPLPRVVSVIIEDGITRISNYAFYDLDVKELVIPASVKTVGRNAFESCDSLTSITFLGDPQISPSTFDGCFNLKNVSFANGSSQYDTTVEGAILSKDHTELIAAMPVKYGGEYTVPAGVTTIGKEAFSSCSRVAKITLPDTVAVISYAAFASCGSIKSISLPESLVEIGDKAFYECDDLEEITIPKNVTTIGKSAFASCFGLEKMEIPSGIQRIGHLALSCFGSQDNIYFLGTEAEWETVLRSSEQEYLEEHKGQEGNWKHDVFGSPDQPTIHFSSTMPASVTSIELDRTNLSLTEGVTDTLKASVLPVEASGEKITWTSSNENVATVVDGTVTAVAPGTATVTAKAGKKSAKCEVRVAPSTLALARTQTVMVDGKAVVFQTYALADPITGYETNYVKLRDVAYALLGTAAQFQVGWNGSVTIKTGLFYIPNGAEFSTPFSGDRAWMPYSDPTYVNGEAVDLEAIVLTDDNGGGYTYYKLRDLGKALGFNVGWNGGIFIQSNVPYSDAD